MHNLASDASTATVSASSSQCSSTHEPFRIDCAMVAEALEGKPRPQR